MLHRDPRYNDHRCLDHPDHHSTIDVVRDHPDHVCDHHEVSDFGDHDDHHDHDDTPLAHHHLVHRGRDNQCLIDDREHRAWILRSARRDRAR
jgi:hypothetical protein